MYMTENNHPQNWNQHSGQQTSLIAKTVKLTTNLYEIRIDKLTSTFFKYEFLPSQSKDLNQKQQIYSSLNGKRLQFEKRIEYICHFKGGFLGSKRVDGVIELSEQQNQKLQLKLVQTYTLEDMLKEDCKETILRHLVDPIVKRSIENCEINIKTDHIGNHKIAITPAFHYDFVDIKKKIYLATNVSIGIKDSYNLQSYFERYKDHESHQKLMINREVIANYGERHTYTIVKIDYTKNPENVGLFDGKQCSFIQFYKEKYIINILNTKQPLLIAKRNNSDKAETEILIPELVSFYNSINPNEMNGQTIEKIQKKKWQLPQQKEIYALRIIKQLGENEIIKKSAHNFDGMVLRPPAIKIENRSFYPEEGIFDFRGRISNAVNLRNWGIFYFEGPDQQKDNNDISKLLFFIKGVCSQYGIKLQNEPGLIPAKRDPSQWKKTIKMDIEKFGTPQFLIFLLRQEELSLYSTLKQHFVMELKAPSQVIRRKSLQIDTRKPFSIVSDILLQIQAKIGGVLWEIESNNQLTKRKLMFGGIYLAKEVNGYSISFVGSVNPQGTQTYSFNKRFYPKLSDINVELLFLYWAKNYVQTSRGPPDSIIIYWQLGEQFTEQFQIKSQISQIKVAINKVGEKTRTANYNPSISYVSASKFHHVQLYSKGENQQKELILQNPDAGTAVMEKNEDESYEFYLNSNRDMDNTSKPIKFSVLESTGINSQSLISFTYEQCYAYYNYKGAVKIPACLQYAKKLANFSEATQVQIGYEDKMTKVLYFL